MGDDDEDDDAVYVGEASPFDEDGEPMPTQTEESSAPAVVPTKAIELAERQVLGALLRDNSLFHHRLADGQGFDEALVPGDFVVTTHRRLFKLIHDALADGRPVTLVSLLGDLAANEEQYLANTLTQAEIDVERASLGKQEKLCELFGLAVDRLLAAQADQNYRQERERMMEKLAGPENDVTLQAAAMLEAQRRLAQRPSPGRILRRGND